MAADVQAVIEVNMEGEVLWDRLGGDGEMGGSDGGGHMGGNGGG